MAVDERERHLLYEKAVEVLGEREAEILMKHLPPGGHQALATRGDLEATGLALRRDLSATRDDLSRDLSATRDALGRDLELLEARTEARTQRLMRQQLMAFVGVMSLMNAGMFAAFRLTL